MDDYFIGINKPKKKKRASRKKLAPKKKSNIDTGKVKFVVRTIGFILFILVIIIFLMISPVFNITDVKVEGNSLLSIDKIISLSEIHQGKNIFRINCGKTKDKILSNSYIESVSIKRVLPSTVVISINERSIKYVLEYADGYAYISGQGYIIDISNEKPEVPILTGLSTETTNIVLGNRLNNDDLKKIETTNRIIEIANSNEILFFITKIDITDDDNYILYLDTEGKKIYLGDASELTTKISLLKAILDKTEGEEGEIFLDNSTGTLKPRFKRNIM